MKSRKILFLITTLAAAGILFSCGKKQEKEAGSASFSSQETDAPSDTGTEAVSSAEEAVSPSAEVYPMEGFTNTGVNFRTGPDTSYEVIELLQQNVPVTLLGEEKGWYLAEVHEQEGYIAMDYVTVGTIENRETEVLSEETEGSTQAETSSGGTVYSPVLSADGILQDIGLFPDVGTLSNVSVPYGNDWENKDANGIPNGIYYYESLYSKYYPVYRIRTSEKILYLTFDEGYEAGYTPAILDTLKEKNVKAVFFITKQFLDSDPELVQRMIDEGHIIGNHTCAHPSGGYPDYVTNNGMQTFVDDLSKLHRMVKEQFGYEMKLFRFPEGESSEMLLAEVNNLGYTSVFWTYAHRDYVQEDQPEVSVTLDRCLSHMAPGAVYLLHAVSSSNTAALGDFIDQARAQGYDFGTFPVEETAKR